MSFQGIANVEIGESYSCTYLQKEGVLDYSLNTVGGLFDIYQSDLTIADIPEENYLPEDPADITVYEIVKRHAINFANTACDAECQGRYLVQYRRQI